MPTVLDLTITNTTIYALRPIGGNGLVFDDGPIEALFAFFCFSGPLIAQLQKVRWLMYSKPNHNIPWDLWLKRIVIIKGRRKPCHRYSKRDESVLQDTMNRKKLSTS
jgi:hypothetical protein